MNEVAVSKRAWTYLWTTAELRMQKAGKVHHAGSNRFEEKGVRAGDLLYIWVFTGGRLLLVGRMEIGTVGPYARIKHLLKAAPESSPFSDHVVARAATEKHFDLEVPLDTIKQLRFISPDGAISGPKLRADGRPDPQTFRGVRKITAESAVLLDRLLGP